MTENEIIRSGRWSQDRLLYPCLTVESEDVRRARLIGARLIRTDNRHVAADGHPRAEHVVSGCV